jgi:hypothetical protein
VFGTESALAALNTEDIIGYVDCSNLSVGDSQSTVLQFDNLEDITIQNTSVTVKVVEDESSTNSEDDNN